MSMGFEVGCPRSFLDADGVESMLLSLIFACLTVREVNRSMGHLPAELEEGKMNSSALLQGMDRCILVFVLEELMERVR